MITTNLEYSIEKTKDGYDILKLNNNDKSIYIGSKYNMKREIEKFLNSFEKYKSERDVFIIYGFGTGEHIKKLRCIYTNKIIIFEPNKNLKSFIRGLKWVKEDKNIKILCCEENELISSIKNEITEFNFKNSEYLSFSNYNQVYNYESQCFFEKLNKYVIRLAIDTNTKLEFSEKWFENLLKIIPYVVGGMPADIYDGKYKNKPAIIVSAGPSLIKNIDMLKEINNDILIFTGGRTLKVLLDKKISFDLLVIADTTDINYELVKDCIEEVNVPLLFSEGANMDIVKHHNGMKLFYSYNDFIYRIVGRKITHISTAGSVAHAMTSYAANLGCNPVIFIGQDFAFTGEKYYSQLTTHSHSLEDEVKNEDDVFVDDIYGNKIRTNHVLNSQRIGMEEIIELYKNVKFINSTEGGAKIRGTEEMNLKEVIDKYRGGKITSFKNVDYSIDLRGNAIRELHRVKEMGNKLYNNIKKMQSNDNFNNIIKEIEDNNFFYYLLYPVIYEFLRADKHKKDYTSDIKKLYLNIINELEYGVKLIDNQLRILEKN